MGVLGRILVEAPDVFIELNGPIWTGAGPKLARLASVKLTPDEADEYGRAIDAGGRGGAANQWGCEVGGYLTPTFPVEGKSAPMEQTTELEIKTYRELRIAEEESIDRDLVSLRDPETGDLFVVDRESVLLALGK